MTTFKDRVLDAIDLWIELWNEANRYAQEHVPPDVLERANENADPASELRGLVVQMALLSDRCRRDVVDLLWEAKGMVLGLENESGNETSPKDC